MPLTIIYGPRLVFRIVLMLLAIAIVWILFQKGFVGNSGAMVLSIEDGSIFVKVKPGYRPNWTSDNENVVKVIEDEDEIEFRPIAPGRARVCGRLLRKETVEEECRNFIVTSGRSSSI